MSNAAARGRLVVDVRGGDAALLPQRDVRLVIERAAVLGGVERAFGLRRRRSSRARPCRRRSCAAPSPRGLHAVPSQKCVASHAARSVTWVPLVDDGCTRQPPAHRTTRPVLAPRMTLSRGFDPGSSALVNAEWKIDQPADGSKVPTVIGSATCRSTTQAAENVGTMWAFLLARRLLFGPPNMKRRLLTGLGITLLGRST